MISKPKQIQVVAQIMERAFDVAEGEEPTFEDVAKLVVSEYHKALGMDLLSRPAFHKGMAFKSPVTGKVHCVAYLEGRRIWIVTADSRYGWLSYLGDKAEVNRISLWDYIEETRANPEALMKNADGWQIGDGVKGYWYEYEIVATGIRCVLLRNQDGQVISETNEYLKTRYERLS